MCALEQDLRPILKGQKDSSPMVLVLAFLVLDLLSETQKERHDDDDDEPDEPGGGDDDDHHVDIDAILEALEKDLLWPVHMVEFSKAMSRLFELRVLQDVDGKRVAL